MEQMNFYWVCLILALCAGLLESCSSSNSSESSETLDSIVTNTDIKRIWKECCDKEAVVIGDVNLTDSKLNGSMMIKAPSFLEQQSRNVQLSYFVYHLVKNYPDIQELELYYLDEGFEEDTIPYLISNKNLTLIVNDYRMNDYYRDAVDSSIRLLGQNEILKFNVIIEKARAAFPNQFTFKGSYWDLLFDYGGDPEDSHNIFPFISIAAIEESGIEPEKLKFLRSLADYHFPEEQM